MIVTPLGVTRFGTLQLFRTGLTTQESRMIAQPSGSNHQRALPASPVPLSLVRFLCGHKK
jgi:hypothetical protein